MKRRIVLLLLGILALIGVSFLMTSPVLGLRAADAWLRSTGGSADTQKYMAMVNGGVIRGPRGVA